MTLAPIRGAPPDAPNPDFPTEEPKVQSAQATEASRLAEQPQVVAKRERGSPIEIRGEDIILTFRVIPELPALRRASMTIHVVSVGSSTNLPVGCLRMSAANATAFLTGLRNDRFPIVAVGDEDGTVKVEFDASERGPVFSVSKPDEHAALHHVLIDRTFDMKLIAGELLGDLGA